MPQYSVQMQGLGDGWGHQTRLEHLQGSARYYDRSQDIAILPTHESATLIKQYHNDVTVTYFTHFHQPMQHP